MDCLAVDYVLSMAGNEGFCNAMAMNLLRWACVLCVQRNPRSACAPVCAACAQLLLMVAKKPFSPFNCIIQQQCVASGVGTLMRVFHACAPLCSASPEGGCTGGATALLVANLSSAVLCSGGSVAMPVGAGYCSTVSKALAGQCPAQVTAETCAATGCCWCDPVRLAWKVLHLPLTLPIVARDDAL